MGGFLILHGLAHVGLALTLTTASYLVLSRVVNLGTISVGALALFSYLRRLRTASTTSDDAAPAAGRH